MTTENFRSDPEVLEGYEAAVSFYRDYLELDSELETLNFLCQTCDGQDRIFGHPENLRKQNYPAGFYPLENSSLQPSGSDGNKPSTQRVTTVSKSSLRDLGTGNKTEQKNTGGLKLL